MNVRVPFFAGALAASVAFATLFSAPAYAGNGTDARAQMIEAQLHPMTNQSPFGAAAPIYASEADFVSGSHAFRAYVPAHSKAARVQAKKLRASVYPCQEF